MADWPEMIYSEWGHAATAAKMSRNKCEGRGAHTYAFSRLNETGVESSVGKISRAPVPVLNICSATEETNLH